MKLRYFKGEHPNFGDELNPWLWPQLIPGLLDDDSSTLFIAIGTIISDDLGAARKVVFGTGYSPFYHPAVPNVHRPDWDIYFVRGPGTARALGLPESLGIGDAATLLYALRSKFYCYSRSVAFMPHWESLGRGHWPAACALAGIRLIDPREPVARILAEISACDLLVTEAMHGAIVADALRIPWVPVVPIDAAHHLKWLDWFEAMKLPFKANRLWSSSIKEVQLLARYRSRFLSKAVQNARAGLRIADPCLTYVAAHRLAALARKDPFLSETSVIESVTGQMLEKLEKLKRDYTARGSDGAKRLDRRILAR